MGREFEAKVLISADEFIDLIREYGLTFSQKKKVILIGLNILLQKKPLKIMKALQELEERMIIIFLL